MKSHIKVMYDPRYHVARSAFEKIIYNIQASYQSWFENRLNVMTNDFPDKIYNYYKYYYDSKHEIALAVKMELPEEMRIQCFDAFNSIFKQKETHHND